MRLCIVDFAVWADPETGELFAFPPAGAWLDGRIDWTASGITVRPVESVTEAELRQFEKRQRRGCQKEQ